MNKAARKAIIIPARYGSTRFPGKPLAKIAGKSMLERVTDTAKDAARQCGNISVIIATEDARIAAHAAEIGVPCIITSENSATGSDRVLEAAQKSGQVFDFIINLQGDAPFTTPDTLIALITAFDQDKDIQTVTPIHALSWQELDRLRDHKATTPFSGTTVTINAQGRALWFSKNIIPAIRNEKDLRRNTLSSPVFQHVGLYGFRTDILEKFCQLPQSPYEKIEGLEQLRLLENDIPVQTVRVELPFIHSGIDCPEDLQRAEQYFLS